MGKVGEVYDAFRHLWEERSATSHPEFESESDPQADGTIQCSGSRTRSGMPRQPCSLRADYRITAQYQARSAQKG